MIRQERKLRLLWWTNPSVLLVISLFFIALTTYICSRKTTINDNSFSFVTSTDAVSVLIIAVAGGLGALLISVYGSHREAYAGQNQSSASAFLGSKWATWLLYGFLGLTVLAYLAWAALAVKHGATPGMVIDALSSKPGALSTLKNHARPVAGLTTFTQLGVVVIVLGLLRSRLRQRNSRWAIITVVVLSLFRVGLYAERISLLEIIFPAIILLLWINQSKVTKKSTEIVLKYVFPFGMVAAVLILFFAGEYVRTWPSVKSTYHGSFFQYGLDRFLSYYMTSVNNGAAYFHLLPHGTTSNYSFYFLYQFPGHPWGVSTVAGAPSTTWWMGELSAFLDVNFTNAGTVFPFMAELGFIPTLLFFVLLGMFAQYLSAKVLQFYLPSLVLLPPLIYAFLELPRISYLTLGRYTPILAASLVVVAVYKIYEIKILERIDPLTASSRIVSEQHNIISLQNLTTGLVYSEIKGTLIEKSDQAKVCSTGMSLGELSHGQLAVTNQHPAR